MPEQARLIRGSGDGWLFLLLCIVLFALPLARGGNRLWALSLFEFFVFALFALWVLQYLRGKVPVSVAIRHSGLVLCLWIMWLGYIAAQLFPLPAPFLAEYAAYSLEAHQAAYEFSGKSLDAAPVSIAPAETRAHLLESFAYFCLFTLVLLMIRSSGRLYFLAITLVISGVFQALYGILFLLSGLEVGLFADKASRMNVTTGTFVNRNHLAGYLHITGAIAIGLVLSQLRGGGASNWRGRLRNLVDFLLSDTVKYRVFIALMVIALVLTRSRTGNIAFFTAIIIAGLLYVLIRERRLFLKSLLVFVTLILIDLWILGNWFGLEEVVDRIEGTDMSREMRVVIWPYLVMAFEAYWPLGTGLGAFYTAFPPFRPELVHVLHDHAHNDYMQFLIETGVGAIFIGAIVALVLIHALRLLLNRKDRLVGGIAFAGIMAMTAIGIHSATDFNLQIPANAATLVVLMAMVMSCSPKRRKRRKRQLEDASQESNDEAEVFASDTPK